MLLLSCGLFRVCVGCFVGFVFGGVWVVVFLDLECFVVGVCAAAFGV